MRASFDRIKVVYVPLRLLSPHPRVQRRLVQRRVDQLVAAFDPVVFGCLKVVPGRVIGGEQHYLIIDGQHRYHAALEWLNGDNQQTVPVRVIPAQSDAEAARTFLEENTVLALRPIDIFLQRVIAKEEVAVGVHGIVLGAGLKMGYGGVDVVTASAACEGLYRKAGGPDALRRVLVILREAWGGRRNAFHGKLVSGLGLLLLEHGDRIADAEMSAKLKRKGLPDDFIGEATSRARTLRMSAPLAVKQTLVAEYNTGRRAHKLPVAA